MTDLYVVSYDLISPGRNYEPLYSELLRLGARRILKSQWIIRSPSTALQLREHFWQFIEDNDRLLVNAIDQSWAAYNLMVNPNEV